LVTNILLWSKVSMKSIFMRTKKLDTSLMVKDMKTYVPKDLLGRDRQSFVYRHG
jgi:hypothetical protein